MFIRRRATSCCRRHAGGRADELPAAGEPSAPWGGKPRQAGAQDQPAAVHAERGGQVPVAAPLRLAFLRARRRSRSRTLGEFPVPEFVTLLCCKGEKTLLFIQSLCLGHNALQSLITQIGLNVWNLIIVAVSYLSYLEQQLNYSPDARDNHESFIKCIIYDRHWLPLRYYIIN